MTPATRRSVFGLGASLALLAVSACNEQPRSNDSAYHGATESAPKPIPFVPSPYRGCGDCGLQARQLAWSIDHQATQWAGDEFRMWRRGVWIWTANRDYGLSVANDDRVSPDGFGWKPSASERSIINAAASDWKDYRRLRPRDIKP